jgi:hypothetical protein
VRQRLALKICIVPITSNVALIFGSEAVITLANGDLRRNPESASKARVPELGELRPTAKLARLMGRQIEATELQELAMMTEATQIAGLGENGHRDHHVSLGRC